MADNTKFTLPRCVFIHGSYPQMYASKKTKQNKQTKTNKQKQTNKTNQNQIKTIPLVQNYNC